MNVWEIVTGNSTLPIQAGNTFWDHLNNQNTGTGTGSILRSGCDITGTIDQNVIEFGRDPKTTTYETGQDYVKKQSSGKTLSASSENRAINVTTGKKKGTFTKGTRKVTIK